VCSCCRYLSLTRSKKKKQPHSTSHPPEQRSLFLPRWTFRPTTRSPHGSGPLVPPLQVPHPLPRVQVRRLRLVGEIDPLLPSRLVRWECRLLRFTLSLLTSQRASTGARLAAHRHIATNVVGLAVGCAKVRSHLAAPNIVCSPVALSPPHLLPSFPPPSYQLERGPVVTPAAALPAPAPLQAGLRHLQASTSLTPRCPQSHPPDGMSTTAPPTLI
jgi:hypothetical protein